MNLHKEISFEEEICGHLASNGWRYEHGDAAHYERKLSLFPSDVVAWVQETQPKAWEALSRGHNEVGARDVLLERVRKQIEDRGTLDVLRHGIEMIGVRDTISLAQFKPALAMNPDILAMYEANRLRVVRQVR